MGLTRTGLLALAVLGASAVPAAAQEDGYGPPPPTREQFVREADAQCKQANPKSHRLGRAFGRAARRGHPVKAGRLMIRLSRHLLQLNDDIAEIERPPDDADVIERWLDLAARSSRIAIASGKAAKEKRITRANRLLERSFKVGRKSSRVVRGFDFKHC